MKQLFTYLIISLFFASCAIKSPSGDNLVEQSPDSNLVDVDFNAFIYLFSTNTAFQYERIKFPLQNESNEENTLIKREQWKKISIYENSDARLILSPTHQPIEMDEVDIIPTSKKLIWYEKEKIELKTLEFTKKNGIWFLEKQNQGKADPKNIVEGTNFIVFLYAFAGDSAFQADRIQYPFELKLIRDIGEPETTMLIQKGKWQYNRDLAQYLFRKKVPVDLLNDINDGISQVLISGIDNGIRIEYYFKLIENKWFLVKYSNVSK
jgi:hypothetical protein